MKSVRLGDALERQVEEAARHTGQPVSQIIRDAVQRRCDELNGQRLSGQLADVLGAVASGGGQSRRTGRQFVETLKRRRKASS